jgi:hypothetical protein
MNQNIEKKSYFSDRNQSMAAFIFPADAKRAGKKKD